MRPSPFGNVLSTLSISVEKKAPAKISKANFPLRYGRYAEIRTRDYEFRFNLNGEIKFIRGLNPDWPHPAEQFRRTDGNDWIYYSVGDKSGEGGVKSWLGEYYLPCLPYPSNAIWEVNYFANPAVMTAFAAWPQLYADLYHAQGSPAHPKVKDLINRIVGHDDSVLHKRAQELDAIIGGRPSVLPPDTRHVDYELIPLLIADGCLYHCKFCCVKSANRFKSRSRDVIAKQIRKLKAFYARNLENYHALFLGNHDALQAGGELIEYAVAEADRAFGMSDNQEMTPQLFLFGSVDSLLRADADLVERLNSLPFYTYINIGFESIHQPTLDMIGKPLDEMRVRDAFQKTQDVNRAYEQVEITGNFIMGETLASEHYQSIAELLNGVSPLSNKKGAIYLSPLKDSPKKRELLPQFNQIKEKSQLPVYAYLIQRL
jgi:hypothetical protein